MSTIAKTNKRTVMFVAAFASVILAGSISAFAVPPNQVAFVPNAVTFTGKCCSSWNETVTIIEPSNVAPVIVTWSADVVIESTDVDDFLVGLSVNGGPCTAYGSREIPYFIQKNFYNDFAVNATHQWVVLRSGLKKGTNTFTLCGGGAHQDLDSISVGLSTLTVLIK
jgi:hypothetical protein